MPLSTDKASAESKEKIDVQSMISFGQGSQTKNSKFVPPYEQSEAKVPSGSIQNSFKAEVQSPKDI